MLLAGMVIAVLLVFLVTLNYTIYKVGGGRERLLRRAVGALSPQQELHG